MTKDLTHLPSVAVLISVIASLAFTVSAVWSFGYWAYFGINLLQYASIDALSFGLHASFVFLGAIATTLLVFVLFIKPSAITKPYLFLREMGDSLKVREKQRLKVKATELEFHSIDREYRLLEEKVNSSGDDDLKKAFSEQSERKDAIASRLRENKESLELAVEESKELDRYYGLLNKKVKRYIAVFFISITSLVLFSLYLSQVLYFLFFSFIGLAILALLVDYRLYKHVEYRSPKLRLMVLLLGLALGLSMVTFQTGKIDARKVFAGESGAQLVLANDSDNYTFLGVLGQRVVLLDRCTKQVTFISESTIERFHFQKQASDVLCKLDSPLVGG